MQTIETHPEFGAAQQHVVETRDRLAVLENERAALIAQIKEGNTLARWRLMPRLDKVEDDLRLARLEAREAEHDRELARLTAREALREHWRPRLRNKVKALDEALERARQVAVALQAEVAAYRQAGGGPEFDGIAWPEVLPSAPASESRLDAWRLAMKQEDLL
jgi:hypothetical protein